MIIESIGVSLLIGKLRKGSFSNMKTAEIYKWYLFVGAFLLEFVTVFLSAKGYKFFTSNIFTMHLISYCLLFIGIYFNIEKTSFKLIMLGTLLNFIVIMLNDGQMPVSQTAMLKAGLTEDLKDLLSGEIITHTIISKNTLLKFLGDVIVIPKPYPRPKVLSIGDIFMGVGVFVYIQEIMIRKIIKK